MEFSKGSKNIEHTPEGAVLELLNHLGELVGELFLQEIKKASMNSEEEKR
jgi:hypothetical protein